MVIVADQDREGDSPQNAMKDNPVFVQILGGVT